MTMISPTHVEAIRRAVGFQASVATDAPADQPNDATTMQQFRHHTRNALQRILCQIGTHAELRHSSHGRQLIADVEQRVLLSAQISDVLFGFTRAPGPLVDRLRILGESTVQLLGDTGQIIRVTAEVEGDCPAALQDIVVRVANEFLGNAVKHGMYARVIGRIGISVMVDADEVRLLVSDDGWGWGKCNPVLGDGLTVARSLADDHDGSVRLSRQCDVTLAELRLPLR